MRVDFEYLRDLRVWVADLSSGAMVDSYGVLESLDVGLMVLKRLRASLGVDAMIILLILLMLGGHFGSWVRGLSMD